ncbi:MAG: hypothetical protein E7Z93_03730 [Cyanobacteria bacterium SIG32]|nr:hypothetical protein [Cyanobacteria bacterium SIG32]
MEKKYNYTFKNIPNWRKEFNNEVLDKTYEYQKALGFEIGKSPNTKTHNNEADAFKHAFMQALLVYKSGGLNLPAKILGDFHEFEGDLSKQPIEEKIMDLWNNKIGRKIAQETLKELKKENIGKKKNQKIYDDSVAQKIYEKIQNNELITKPFDDWRINNHIFTREEIGKMSSEDFLKNEKLIMKQLREKGIPKNSEIKKTSSTKSTSSQSENGHWVTINGNHVFIEK